MAIYGKNGTLATRTGGATGSSTVPNVPGGRQDLALAIASGSIIVGARIMRDVDLNSGVPFAFSFTPSDQGSGQTVPPFSLPTGVTQGNFFTFFRTPGVTMPLASGTASGGSYYTIPAAAAMAADHYVGVAIGTGTDRLVSHGIAGTQPTSYAFELPPIWSGFIPPTPSASPTFTGLDGTATDHRGFRFDVKFTMGARAGTGWAAFVSCGWLNGGSSYTAANPVGLAGFMDLARNGGDPVEFTVESIFSNRALADLMGAPAVANMRVPVGAVTQKTTAVMGTFQVP
jgi:hypothetical protein